MANKLVDVFGYVINKNNCTKVCTALNNNCMHTIGQLTCHVNIFNEKINNYEYFEINFKVLDIKYDMIIGRHTIKKYDLTQVCRSQFTVSHTDYVLPADGNPFAKAHKSELRAGTQSESNRHSERYIRKYLNKNLC
jgi:hypothetical protein